MNGYPLHEWFRAMYDSKLGEGQLAVARIGEERTVSVFWEEHALLMAQDGCAIVLMSALRTVVGKADTPAELRMLLDVLGELLDVLGDAGVREALEVSGG